LWGSVSGRSFAGQLRSALNDDLVSHLGGGGNGDEYLLKIEEVEGPAPRVEQVQGAPPTENGWLEAAQGNSDQVRVVKSIELLVSINSRFHLTIRDHGDIVELSGRLKESAFVPGRARPIRPYITTPAGATAAGSGGTWQDLLVEVEYKHASDGDIREMRSPIPIRLGKKWFMAGGFPMVGGGRGFPQMLWSVEKLKAESGK